LPGLADHSLATVEAHQGIIDALAAGDSAGAAQAMAAHFDGIRHRLASSQTEGPTS
jgi:DNA-binding GntR family transcriptional regulator